MEEELNSKETILVDFNAKWCGPCRMLSPILDSITSIKLVKIDVDLYPSIASKYNVTAIPMLAIMQNGIIKASKVGLIDKTELDKFIELNK